MYQWARRWPYVASGRDAERVIGRILGGRYRLDSALGRGGMATVWAARDLRLERPVAVKLLDAHGAADEVAAERFRREAHAVARLSHPNIVAVHDFDVDEETPYLVMELLTGRSVDDMLADGPLPVHQAISIATQAARALAAAHAAGVVHRDIKPGNLLVDDRRHGDESVKVLDFGIAQLQHTEQRALTRTAMAMGTSHYMAPETARGERAGPQADLYGLGCTLYAMLTGAPPFVGSSPIAVLHKQVTELPPPVRLSRPEVPQALHALVAELLAKDPGQRPPNAGAVAARLVAMPVGGMSTTGAMETVAIPVYETQLAAEVHDGHHGSAVRRYALPVAAALAVLVLLGAGLVLWWGSGGTPRAGGSTVTPTVTAPPSQSSAAPSPRPSTPAGHLAQLRLVVRQQVAAGEINGDAGEELGKKLDEIGKALRQGKQGDAVDRVDNLRDSLDGMRNDGKVSDTGYSALDPVIESLAESLPAGNGNDGKDRDGNGRGNDGNEDDG